MSWPVVAEIAVLAAILLLAWGLRAQHLGDIPRYADEIQEIKPAFDIARGRDFPLTSGPKHIGSFFPFVLAGAMLTFGRSPDLPRDVVFFAGMATVLLTYGYARMLGGRVAAAVAAGLLAVSAPHVLLSSRVAWSASLTPLLAVGAAWALDRAVSGRSPRWVVAAGLLAGLALQTHPSFVAILPGLLLFGLLRGRHLFRRPALYLAGLLFVLGCANVLVYNLTSGLGGLESVERQYPEGEMGLAAFAGNVLAPASGIALAVASAVGPGAPSPLDPGVIPAILVAAFGLGYAAWRSSPLPLLAVLSALAVLPLLHDSFGPLLKFRYVMPLLPLIFVAIGVATAPLLRAPLTSGLRTGRAVLVAGLLAVLAASALGPLLRFEAAALAADCTNAPQRAFVAELERQRRPGEWVLIDKGILRSAERMGYLTLLELSRSRVGEVRLERGGVRRELAGRDSFLTAVDDGKVDAVFARQAIPLSAEATEALRPVLERLRAGVRGDGGIGLYRVIADEATLLAHDPEPGCGDLPIN